VSSSRCTRHKEAYNDPITFFREEYPVV
jgi:hypothetical protein